MDSIIKATVVFFALWAIIRVSGRRTLGEMSAFDFVLFMIIGGSTQRAITGQDYSMTNALLLVGTFIMLDIALSIFELRSPLVRHVHDAFGRDRTMWASNFPMDKPTLTLPASLGVLVEALGDDADLAALTRDVATRVYRLS